MPQAAWRPSSVRSSLPQMLAGACLVFLAALSLLLLGMAQWSRVAHMDKARQQARDLSRLGSSEMVRRIELADLVLAQTLALAGQRPEARPEEAWMGEAGERLHQDLRRLALHLPNVNELLLIDAAGRPRIAAIHDLPAGLDASGRDYFQAERQGERGLLLSGPRRSDLNGQPVFILSRRVGGADGSFLGAATLSFRAVELSRLLESLLGTLPYTLSIYGTGGRLLAAYPAPGEGRLLEGRLPEVLAGAVAESETGSLIATLPDGAGPSIVAWQRLAAVPMVVVSSLSLRDVLADWRQDMLPSFVFGLSALAGVTLLGGMAARRARAEQLVQTRLVEAGDVLEAMLTEKDALLAEIHHRVKNNMQVIVNLLHMEAFRLADAHARSRLEVLGRRVALIGRVHERIYAADSFARLDFSAHLAEHCGELTAGRPEVTLAIEAEPLACGLDLALPLSLIAHELVSNAVLHGGPPHRIAVRLASHGGLVELAVGDSGGPPPEGAGADGPAAVLLTQGLGLALVRVLASQIDATVDFCSYNGFHARVMIPAAAFMPAGR